MLIHTKKNVQLLCLLSIITGKGSHFDFGSEILGRWPSYKPYNKTNDLQQNLERKKCTKVMIHDMPCHAQEYKL